MIAEDRRLTEDQTIQGVYLYARDENLCDRSKSKPKTRFAK